MLVASAKFDGSDSNLALLFRTLDFSDLNPRLKSLVTVSFLQAYGRVKERYYCPCAYRRGIAGNGGKVPLILNLGTDGSE